MGGAGKAGGPKLQGKNGWFSVCFLMWPCGLLLTFGLLSTLLLTGPWTRHIRERSKKMTTVFQAPNYQSKTVNSTDQPWGKVGTVTCQFKELHTASDLFHEDRFDLLMKLLYIRFVHRSHVEGLLKVPSAALEAYLQHEKVWNHFREDWKRTPQDFQTAFEKTYSSVVQNGFSPAHAIPIVLQKDSGQVWLKNGAHRSAIAVTLGLDAIPVYCVNESTRKWDWRFFHERGLSRSLIDMAVYHFLTHTEDVFMLNVWPKGLHAMKKLGVTLSKVLGILRRNSGKVVYYKEVSLNFVAHGMYVHMAYGDTSWLSQKQNQTYVSNNSMLCIFVLFRNQEVARLARDEARSLLHLATEKWKDTVHMTVGSRDLLLLSRQILFSNSLHYMNFSSAEGKLACHEASVNLASVKPVNATEATPGIPLHVDHFSVDAGSVLSFYGLRPRTNYDLIYDNHLRMTNCRACGEKVGMHIVSTRRFRYHNVSVEDILYNPENVGYCYGLKYVALKQVLSYKQAIYEESKDARDMELIQRFLQSSS